ncbi:LysR substrate-binding domain-containing protein [Rhizobiaceae bacterium BDR2-2]|uniref:LysR substrate-binding domain-containing protein n=2 Tax=Ectorhizobium quercum TaxID=2965071 RepID=A0AAE3SVV8_9HYPH|nr:LysR substrate-binding domain-containing protein [Ectorhizobium quercum]
MGVSFSGLSLRDLEYLVAVGEHLHFGKAAEHCGVSQPALSAQIKKLEAAVGVVVFERSPRRVLVTAKGREILERTRSVLREASALMNAGRDDRPLSGSFRLGALPTLGPYLLPRIMRPLRKAFPEMRLVISEDRSDRLLAALKEGELDAILVCRPEEDGKIAVQRLFFEPFTIMHPVDWPPVWPPRDGSMPVLLLEEGHCLHDQVKGSCEPYPFLAFAARRASSLEMLRQMIAAGEGISLVPALAAAALDRNDRLTANTPLPAAGYGREIVLCYRHSDPRAAHIAGIVALMRDGLNDNVVAVPATGRPVTA